MLDKDPFVAPMRTAYRFLCWTLGSLAYAVCWVLWEAREAFLGNRESQQKIAAIGLILAILLVFACHPRQGDQVKKQQEGPVAFIGPPAPLTPEVIDLPEERRALRTARPDLPMRTQALPTMVGIQTWGASGSCPTPSVDGAILRALRWQPLVWAVEDRYDLPRNLLMVILIQESMGSLLLNCGDDGGAGLLHKQFNTAHHYGLKTLNDRGEPRVVKYLGHPSIDRVGGQQLRHLFEVTCRGSLECAAKRDDRFHLLLDIDSAARKLVLDMGPIQGKGACLPVDGLGSLYRSLCRYSGRPWLTGKRSYFVKLAKWQQLIENPAYLRGLEQRFNAANTQATIGDKPATFHRYLQAFADQANNWGLKEYYQLPRYSYPEAEAVKKSWATFQESLQESIASRSS